VDKIHWGLQHHGNSYQVQAKQGSLRHFVYFNGNNGKDSFLMIGHKDGDRLNNRRSNFLHYKQITATTKTKQAAQF
jgi:hypothetical protein